jgi:hypothetical protein
MKTTATLPPIEIFEVLQKASAAGIIFPPEVYHWWDKESPIQKGGAPTNCPEDKIMDQIIALRAENRSGAGTGNDVAYTQPASIRINQILNIIEQVYNELSSYSHTHPTVANIASCR